MRNMSFILTTDQIRDQSKTVTRRLGWKFLKPGDLVQAIVKGQGLKKGEKVEKLAVIRVVDVRREPLMKITAADCRKEGFPDLVPLEFLAVFCMANKCQADAEVTRIEFEYVNPNQ